jgi:DNA-binding response OmpR family regulator
MSPNKTPAGEGAGAFPGPASRRILVVEDDEKLAEQVIATLKRARYQPTRLSTGTEALKVAPGKFSLIILDLMLPGVHGLDVLKHMRSQSEVPILVLSARNETNDKVRALQLGADDFVTKPFWPDELVERVNARIRRPTLMRNNRIAIGALTIDLAARSVFRGRRAIDLTKVEFDLLATLIRRSGDAISRRSLAESALGPDRASGDRVLDVHMSRLRKKLGVEGRRLATVWGIGYRFEVNPTGR